MAALISLAIFLSTSVVLAKDNEVMSSNEHIKINKGLVLKENQQELKNVRWARHINEKTGAEVIRVVMDCTEPIRIETTFSNNPGPIIAIKIKDAIISDQKINNIILPGIKAVQRLSIEQNRDDINIKIEVPQVLDNKDFKVFTLKKDDENQKLYRLVIDIYEKKARKFNYSPSLKNKIIIIDPGHGGSDVGAIGLNSKEKDLTLAISIKLEEVLKNAGAKVVMTRRRDVDVYRENADASDELMARVNIANNNKADIFISIHIDAFNNNIAGGTTTYFFQKTPYDMMLAQNIQNELLLANEGLKNRGHRMANFFVLKYTEMPAILAELAFISNPLEEQRLLRPDYQEKLALAIKKGLEGFLSQASKE